LSLQCAHSHNADVLRASLNLVFVQYQVTPYTYQYHCTVARFPHIFTRCSLLSLISYWEVWNEPQNFQSGSQSAADYAAIVVSAYKAAKAADPNAKVGVTVASVDIVYLEQTIAAGAKENYDYICLHP
jgi:hypothetical protein